MRKFGRYGVLGAAAALGWAAAAASAEAQMQERHRVLVVALKPLQGADDDFGKDFAKRLRDLIDESNTHQSIEEKELKDAAKRFDIKVEDVDCILGVQLGNQMGANLVFCGSYTEDKQAKTVAAADMKFQAPGGNSFGIDDAVWGEKEDEQAAQDVYTQFGSYIGQIRAAIFCKEYYDSKDWVSAEENCGRALEMKPDDADTRFVYAMMHMQQGRTAEDGGDAAGAGGFYGTSYEEVQALLEQDPLHEDGLELAGFLAAKLDHADEARAHYAQFLQLDPNNANVRMRVAYDLALAGDAEGAMLLIEEGLALDSENIDLLLQHAAFAARAAQEHREGLGEDDPLPAEAVALYEKVLSSYDKAYEVQGEDMDVAHLRNMVAAYSELGRTGEAVSMAERVLRTHGVGVGAEQADLWFRYANVLKKADRLEDAIAALDTVEVRDGAFPNIKVTQGRWMLEADQPQEALANLQAAVERGEQHADVVARLLLSDGLQKGRTNHRYAIRMVEMAKGFEGELTETVLAQMDFWHGYKLFERAKEVQNPESLQSAQQALPLFQQAARLLGLPRVATYAADQPSIKLQQLRDAIQQYIEIQQALIQRGI